MKELMKKLLIELPIHPQQKTQDKDEETSTLKNPGSQTMKLTDLKPMPKQSGAPYGINPEMLDIIRLPNSLPNFNSMGKRGNNKLQFERITRKNGFNGINGNRDETEGNHKDFLRANLHYKPRAWKRHFEFARLLMAPKLDKDNEAIPNRALEEAFEKVRVVQGKI